MKIQGLWLSVTVVSLGCCGASLAQTAASGPQASSGDALAEVVVTAERRHTDLQTTPISATVLTGGDLANMGITSVDQLQFTTPGAVVDNFGQGIDFNIRGIGKGEHNSQTTVGVVTYRDGVATFPGYFQEEPYYDIPSLEILRGPQGTFGGQNATGGAVFVTTNDPVIGGAYQRLHVGAVRQLHRLCNAGRGQPADQRHPGGAHRVQRRDARQLLQHHRPEWRCLRRQPRQPASGAPASACCGSLIDSLTVLFKNDYNYLNMGAYPADPYYGHRRHVLRSAPTRRNRRSTGSAARS